jgi:hypothetical protein
MLEEEAETEEELVMVVTVVVGMEVRESLVQRCHCFGSKRRLRRFLNSSGRGRGSGSSLSRGEGEEEEEAGVGSPPTPVMEEATAK